jgi:DNA-binding NtrC family response regulator
VRQLRNNVERLMILAGGDPDAVINADMLPQDVGSMVPSMPGGDGGEHLMGLPLREAREVFERNISRLRSAGLAEIFPGPPNLWAWSDPRSTASSKRLE